MNDAAMVYFTTLGADEDVAKEYKYFKQLTLQLLGPVKTMVFRMSPDAENYQELKKQFRVPKLDVGKPDLRYYPNEVTGQQKLERSFGLPLDLKSRDFQPIIEEIESAFESHITDIQAHMFNQYIIQYAKEQ